MITGSSPQGPQRSHARSNHARILAAAREELSRNPDASLDEIARAAGVVRRTLYGHFPNRRALVAALVAEASQSVQQATTAARRPGDSAPVALARMVLASLGVGDRYRMLISLGRHDLGEEGLRAALAPGRAAATAILERGQADGVFADCLPAPVLALAIESFGLAVLEGQVSTGWRDPDGEAGTTALLIAAGVAPAAARRYVRTVLSEGHQRTASQPGTVSRGFSGDA